MDEPERTPSRRRVMIAAAAVAFAVAAAVSAVVLLSSPSRPQHHVAAPAPVIVAVTPTPPPSSSTAAPPPRPRTPHDRVAPAVPTRFTLNGHGFTINAHVCAMAPVFPLDPPGEQHHTVCWVTKGFGHRPSSHSRGTSYLLGHSWAEDPLEVLNKASVRATRDILHAKMHRLDGVPIYPARSLVGSRITLRTPSGTLVYETRNAFGVDKYRLGNIDSIMDPRVRNRVVLITCAELHGVDYHYNVVLDARLVSSSARGRA